MSKAVALVGGKAAIIERRKDGKIAGDIGVGGGTEEQDCAIAEHVVSVFNKLTE